MQAKHWVLVLAAALVVSVPASARSVESITVPPFHTVPLRTKFDADTKYKIVYSGFVSLISTEKVVAPAKKPAPIIVDGLFYNAAVCSKASKLETVSLIDTRGAIFSPHGKYRNLTCNSLHTYTLYVNDRPPPVRELVGGVKAKSNLSPSTGRVAVGGITVTVTPASGGPVVVSYKNRQFVPNQITVENGAILKICNNDNVLRAPFTNPLTAGPNKFKVTLKPGACLTRKLVNPGKARLRLVVFDVLLSQIKLVIFIQPA